MANGKQKVEEIVLDVTTMDNGHEVVDEIVLEIADSIGERLKASSQKQMNEDDFTISRVPAALRRGKEVYYEPGIVSIGPYHHGEPKFEAMEVRKLRQLEDFLKRNPNISMNTYLGELRKLETEARRCYFENINLSSKEFVEMMLLDGCFVLEFLKQNYPDSTQTITFNSYFIHQVSIDLLLLGNQIPFLVLQCLYNLNTGYGNNPSLLELASECFLKYCKICESNRNGCLNCECKYDHLLHLFHCFHHPTIEREQPKCKNDEGPKTETVPCATKLVEAGITFKKKDSNNFFRVTFNDGKIEVPCFSIDDSGGSLMMNLIAFEQLCNLPSDKKLVSFYAAFMDHIIDTPKDVEILQENNILESYINSDKETANFFNRLSDHVLITSNKSYLLPVIEEINKYCANRRHQWRAKLMSDHFSNPWAILSLVAAIILLILSFLQTFFAIYSYFKPSN